MGLLTSQGGASRYSFLFNGLVAGMPLDIRQEGQFSVHGVGFGHHGAGVFTRGVCVWQKLDGERHMHALARIDNDKSSPVRLMLSRLMSFWSSFVETMSVGDPASPALFVMQ
jgi:hypothetical protein